MRENEENGDNRLPGIGRCGGLSLGQSSMIRVSCVRSMYTEKVHTSSTGIQPLMAQERSVSDSASFHRHLSDEFSDPGGPLSGAQRII